MPMKLTGDISIIVIIIFIILSYCGGINLSGEMVHNATYNVTMSSSKNIWRKTNQNLIMPVFKLFTNTFLNTMMLDENFHDSHHHQIHHPHQHHHHHHRHHHQHCHHRHHNDSTEWMSFQQMDIARISRPRDLFPEGFHKVLSR